LGEFKKAFMKHILYACMDPNVATWMQFLENDIGYTGQEFKAAVSLFKYARLTLTPDSVTDIENIFCISGSAGE
jgi:hypothetical protein